MPATRTRGRAAKKTVQEPFPKTLGTVIPDNDRPTDHNGVPIEREELIGNLPKAPFRISRLILANEDIAYACRDCVYTADTRGEVMVHRNEAHGIELGGRRKIADLPPQRSTPDVILPPRPDGNPAPSEPLQWTLAELLAVAPSIAALGDMVEESNRKLEAAEDELHSLKLAERERAAKADLYDEQREELLALRNWKRKMITRLNQMGFSLSEEEQ